MKRHWIEYYPIRHWSAISGWMTVPNSIEPPGPLAVPDRSHPYFYVEFNGFTFGFASLDEIRFCIATLEQKILPQTLGHPGVAGRWANKHWISRLPARVKAWRYRARAVPYLRKALAAFEKELAG